jgi:hypothetical protein
LPFASEIPLHCGISPRAPGMPPSPGCIRGGESRPGIRLELVRMRVPVGDELPIRRFIRTIQAKPTGADQCRKQQRFLDKAGVGQGTRVLEIGTGWADAVTIELKDYRAVEGEYDAVVSVEMIEAVGSRWVTTMRRPCASGRSGSCPVPTRSGHGLRRDLPADVAVLPVLLPGGLRNRLPRRAADCSGSLLLTAFVVPFITSGVLKKRSEPLLCAPRHACSTPATRRPQRDTQGIKCG